MSAPQVVVAGNLNVDLVLGTLADWPGWGREVIVNQSDRRAGGIAHAACALAALAVPVGAVATVGADADGAFLVAWLERAGVDVGAVRQVASEVTGLSVSVVRTDGERTFFTHPGSLHAEGADGLLARLPDGVRWVLLSGLMLLKETPASDVRRAMERLRAGGARVAVDPGWDPEGWPPARLRWTREILAGADLVLVNEEECAALELVVHPVAGSGLLAIKQGPQGATVVDGAGRTEVAGEPVHAVDTVGAGDVWNAAFLCALLAGDAAADAARDANRVAAEYVARPPGPGRYPARKAGASGG